MSKHTVPPFKIAIEPAATIARSSAHERLTVVNEGRTPLTIRTGVESYQRVNGHCVLTHLDGSHWGKVTPAAFTLAPNHVQRLHVRVDVPQSARGQHDLLVTATGMARGHKGNVSVHGVVGSLLDLKLPGSSNACVSLSAPQHAAGGFPWALAVALVCLAAVLAVVFEIIRRSRRGRVRP